MSYMKKFTPINDWALTDVPLGAFKRGLDSSFTTATLAKEIDHLKTYTIGFAEEDTMNSNMLK